MNRFRRLTLALAVTLAAAPLSAQTAEGGDALADGFATPPATARPWLWWHWMDGNISREGIDLDLAWMKRTGIGGFQIFDVALRTPQVVDHRLIYMTPAWKQAYRYAIETAAGLGIEAGIASSPGWSETGGPWVPPDQAMKKLVWSETLVEGGRAFAGRLAPPPAVAGPFQDIPGGKASPFYRDVATLAYRLPADAVPVVAPRVTSSGGTLDGALLAEARLDRAPGAVLPFKAAGSTQWIRFDYPAPRTIRSLVVTLADAGRFDLVPEARLEASDDGATFRRIADLPFGSFRQTTSAFAPVTARAFRIVFKRPADNGPFWRRITNSPAPGIVEPPFGLAPRPQDLRIQRLALFEDTRVNRFEEKAGFAAAEDYYALAGAAAGLGSIVPADGVRDLTKAMRPDGGLDWTPPSGRWVVLRLGYALTGQTNGPAPAESVGFEVDKLNAAHVADYMAHYLQTYRETLGPDLFGARGVSGILTDSFEAGPQNWTDDMPGEFRRRRGYDPLPWLPALTGRVIGSAAASDRFLYDFRRTIADLIAANHYGQVARSAHAAGLTVRGEALENHRPILGDDMAMRSHADEPMGAIWAPGRDGAIDPTVLADIKGAASVAHLWGRRFVDAESFTSALQPWAGSPRTLKSTADAALALGVTRFMLHSSVHQPAPDKVPGMTLSIFGQYFNRNETWAEQARPWTDYLARNAFMLQQGRFAADIAYFTGEEAPLTALYGDAPVADVPAGHGYDFVNVDALALFRVEGGALVTPSGMRYRVLQLGGSSRHMTVPVLRRLAELVEAGATVIGVRPADTPSLADDPVEFGHLTDRLWDAAAARHVRAEPAEAALAALGIAPDWRTEGVGGPPLMVLHRTVEKAGDIYFLSSRSHAAARTEISFRVTGLVPELWDADTGGHRALAYRIEQGRTIVPLAFDPDGSALVVFRRPGNTPSPAAAEPVETVLARLDAGWKLGFQSGRGAPTGTIDAAAGSWSDSSIASIRYFSGTGTYQRDVTIAGNVLASGRRVLLDLGEVAELADVAVNGRTLRTLWKPPYRLDITGALHPGVNRITLRVTDLWVNRLIGDAQPGAHPITWTAAPTYRADAPLRPAGLIGPVRLIGLLPKAD